MAIAKLSIDLEARLAGLQAGLDKAGLLAEQSARKIEQSFAGLRTVGLALGGLGSGLAAAFTVPALVTFINRTAEGLAALNDLKDATGASIENLSALEDIAARTGTNFDSMGDAIVKMNKALADAKPGTDAAAAFTALGLSIDELKRLDPVEAFQRLAVALQGFADDGNKARVVQELFGKSLREVAPLLKNVAEAGKLVATVMTRQAEEAERWTHETAALEKRLTDFARTIEGPVVSALNKTFQAFRESREAGKGFFETLREEQLKLLGIGNDIMGLRNQIAGIDTALSDAQLPDQYRIGLLEKRLKITQQLAALMPALDSKAGAGRGFVNPELIKPSLPASLSADTLKRLGTQDRISAAEFAARAMLQVEEESAQTAAEAWQFWDKAQIAASQERADAAKEQWKQVFEFIDQEQERAIEEGQASVAKVADAWSVFADQSARNIQDAIGNTLEDTLSGHFDNVLDLWKNLLIRMASQAAAAQIGKELFGDFGSTGNIGGTVGKLIALFGSANGNAFGPGGMVQPLANGGILGPNGGLLTRPTVFPMANGGLGLGGEAGIEAVMPLKRGRDGKLGVAAQGGGRSVVVNHSVTNYIDSRTDVAVVGRMVAEGVQQGQRQMLEYLKAGGVIQ